MSFILGEEEDNVLLVYGWRELTVVSVLLAGYPRRTGSVGLLLTLTSKKVRILGPTRISYG